MNAVTRRRVRTPHPGTIEVFEDGTLAKTLDAAKLPDRVKYAPDRDGTERPVVRVLTTRTKHHVHVKEFGADGSLLRASTHIVKAGG